MIDFSATYDDVLENARALHTMGSGDDREQGFHFDRLYNAEHQVALYSEEGLIFAPVKWCGTKSNSRSKYENRKQGISSQYQNALRKIGFQMVDPNDPRHGPLYTQFLKYCSRHGFKVSAAGLPHSNSEPRKFWIIKGAQKFNGLVFPDEINETERYFEGIGRKVNVNRYERSRDARHACIAHHQPICKVCEIDFGSTYGPLGAGFIHVHHKVPLNQIDSAYEVDPINDLVPVCPNCHAMLHRREPPLTVEELASLLEEQESLKT